MEAEYQAPAGCPVLLPVWSPSPAGSGSITASSGEILSKSAFESWLLSFDLPLFCSSLLFCPVSQSLGSLVRFQASRCPYVAFQSPPPTCLRPLLFPWVRVRRAQLHARVPDLPARCSPSGLRAAPFPHMRGCPPAFSAQPGCRERAASAALTTTLVLIS